MATESTPLALPADLHSAVDQMVLDGRARSRSELIEHAVRRELAEAKRAAVDEAFSHMANDADYQLEAHQILAEFAQADSETLPRSLRPTHRPA